MEQVQKIDSKLNSIELLRIIGVILILVFHAFYFLDKHCEIYKYCRTGGYYVELFFIIAGFFLPNILYNKISFKKFALKKIIRLFPIVFTVTIFVNIFHSHLPLYKLLPDFMLLNSVGFYQNIVLCGFCWFLYVLFWVCCFYYCLLNFIKNKEIFTFIVSIIIYASLIILTNGAYGHNINAYQVFNTGVLRGLAGVGIGIIIRLHFYNPNFRKPKICHLIFTAIEVFILAYILIYFTLVPITQAIQNLISYMIIFSTIVVLFVNNCGYLSMILNRINFYSIGKYAFSIYIMQTIPAVFLHITKQINGYTYVGLYLLCSILLGVAAYHAIEVPCRKIYKSSMGGGGKALVIIGFDWNIVRLNYEIC